MAVRNVNELNDLPVRPSTANDLHEGTLAHVPRRLFSADNIVCPMASRVLMSNLQNGGASTLDIVDRVRE